MLRTTTTRDRSIVHAGAAAEGPPAGHFPRLDALRGLAALSVFAYHAAKHFDDGGPLARVALHGNAGVPIFFALSGLLLYRPFVAAGAERSGSLLGFYSRRAVRIVPAYWSALLLLAVYPGLPLMGERWYQFMLFGQIYDPGTTFAGIGAAWSLCIEVSFYAVLPLVAPALCRLPPARHVALLAVLAAASVLAHDPLDSIYANASYTLPGTFYLFAAGMALAVVHVHRPDWFELTTRRQALCYAAAAALFLLLALGTGELGSAHPLFLPLAVLVLVPSMSAVPSMVGSALTTAPLVWLGHISYAFYLWHAAVLALAAERLGGAGLSVSCALAVSLSVAALSWHLVERPALRAYRRWQSWRGLTFQPPSSTT